MDKLTLTIEGPANSGKSKLASTLYKVLADAGVTVGLHDEPGPPALAISLEGLAELLAHKGVRVMIVTKQAPK